MREGLALRFTLKAPYRCLECKSRFYASSREEHFGRRRNHRNLASFLGFRGQQRRQLNRWVMTASLAAVLVWIAIYLVMHLAEPGTPVQPAAP